MKIEIKLQKNETLIKKNELQDAVRKLTELQRSSDNGVSASDAPRQSSYHKCPEESCRGFLTDQVCNVCHVEVCRRCMHTKQTGHVCNADVVETVRMLKNDTKPCPGANCKALITKIDGCDQMWCTACHTTFSWKTGAPIVRGNVHNPHYVDFLRNNGTLERNPADIACGGIPSFRLIVNVIREMELLVGKSLKPMCWMLSEIVAFFHHNAAVETLRYMPADNSKELTGLRVKYLLNEIDEKRWRSELHKHYKEDEKNAEFLQVIAMVNETGATVLREVYMKMTDMTKTENVKVLEYATEIERALKMLDTLRVYSNAELTKIGQAFLNMHPVYLENFEFQRRNHTST
jgi:hypothetical protein